MDSDWAYLPGHLLDAVLERLKSLIDYLQFSVVCASWQSVAKYNQNKRIKNLSNHHVPLLLVPSIRYNCRVWSIYNILENKFLESKWLLPQYDRQFGGSSDGWLVTIDKRLAVTLYKPFLLNESKSNAIIHLPPLLPPRNEDELNLRVRYREYYVFKVATCTPDPVANPNDLIVVVIFGEFRDLAYIRPVKDNNWTRIISVKRVFLDVMYLKDQFYAITCWGELVAFNVTESLESKIKLVAVDRIPMDNTAEAFCYKHYLVESCKGELLQVKRYIARNTRGFDRETIKFKVFKLSLAGPRWIEILDLGDAALFLGDNTSISVLASNFVGCQRNCIYFTHDKYTTPFGDSGPSDLGVYSLENGSVTPHFTIDPATIAKTQRRGPIWVLPALNIY